MASIVLGSGENSIKIEGDALRVDQLAVHLNESNKESSFKVTSGPDDDVRISDIPKAIREVADMIVKLDMIKTNYKLPVGKFVSYKPEMEAWSEVGDKEVLTKDSLIGYAFDSNHVKICGLFPMTDQQEDSYIIINGWLVGRVLSPNIGYLTPWEMKRVEK